MAMLPCRRCFQKSVVSLPVLNLPQTRSCSGSFQFVAGQYNILAGYLGNNMEPWFLYGPKVCETRRAQINELHQRRTPEGRYANFGWPNYVRGVLSADEQAEIERIHQEFFAWEKRKHRLVDVIDGMRADVLSLVECDNYEEFFKSQLDAMGYDSVWCKRPRHQSLDGCCVAWRRSKFELLSHTWVEYCDTFDDIGRPIGQKDRVALLSLLRSPLTGDRVCVVSTHLARNPELEELDKLRCRQVGQVVRRLGSFVTEHSARSVPVVLLGDMNATSFRKLLGMSSAATLLRKDETFAHPFIFECADVPSGPTSCTAARNVRIDAILYQTSCMEMTAVGDLPMLRPEDPIPNKDHPSDHVPITSTFRVFSELEVAKYWAREWYLEVARKRGSSLPLGPDQLAIAFSFYDRNGDGCVTIAELRQSLLSLMGKDHASEEELITVLANLPQDRSFGFHVFVMAYLDATARSCMPGLDNLEEAFHAFDLDRDGVLSVSEVQKVFLECCPTEAPDEDTMISIFEAMDASRDGAVQLDEFLSYLNRAWQQRLADACNVQRTLSCQAG